MSSLVAQLKAQDTGWYLYKWALRATTTNSVYGKNWWNTTNYRGNSYFDSGYQENVHYYYGYVYKTTAIPSLNSQKFTGFVKSKQDVLALDPYSKANVFHFLASCSLVTFNQHANYHVAMNTASTIRVDDIPNVAQKIGSYGETRDTYLQDTVAKEQLGLTQTAHQFGETHITAMYKHVFDLIGNDQAALKQALMTHDSCGYTPLHYAFIKGNYIWAFSHLIDAISKLPAAHQEAILFAADNEGKTIFHYFVKNWSLAAIKDSFVAKLDKNIVIKGLQLYDKSGKTALDYCFENTWVTKSGNATPEYLLQLCGKKFLPGVSADGYTPFHYAARSHYLPSIEALIKHFPKEECQMQILKQNYRGWNALHYAARSGDVAVLEKLLESLTPEQAKQGLQARTLGGQTALHYACAYGTVPMIELILQKLGPQIAFGFVHPTAPHNCNKELVKLAANNPNINVTDATELFKNQNFSSIFMQIHNYLAQLKDEWLGSFKSRSQHYFGLLRSMQISVASEETPKIESSEQFRAKLHLGFYRGTDRYNQHLIALQNLWQGNPELAKAQFHEYKIFIYHSGEATWLDKTIAEIFKPQASAPSYQAAAKLV